MQVINVLSSIIVILLAPFLANLLTCCFGCGSGRVADGPDGRILSRVAQQAVTTGTSRMRSLSWDMASHCTTTLPILYKSPSACIHQHKVRSSQSVMHVVRCGLHLSILSAVSNKIQLVLIIQMDEICTRRAACKCSRGAVNSYLSFEKMCLTHGTKRSLGASCIWHTH